MFKTLFTLLFSLTIGMASEEFSKLPLKGTETMPLSKTAFQLFTKNGEINIKMHFCHDEYPDNTFSNLRFLAPS